MAEVWLTHDGDDNRGYAVTFAVAELERAGLVVRPDARDLRSAQTPLWRQVSNYVINSKRVGTWYFYVTEDSLSGGTAAAEIVQAVQLARERRRAALPAAVVCPGSLSSDLLTPELQALGVIQMTDQYWAQRLRAVAEGRRPEIPPPGMPPYALTLHHWGVGDEQRQALEVRPRLGRWSPFVAGVPAEEREAVRPRLLYGFRGHARQGRPVEEVAESASGDGTWWMLQAEGPADRLNSYFLLHDRLPETVLFGAGAGHVQYTVRLRPLR